MRGGAQKEPRISQIAVFEKGWLSRKAALYVYAEGDPSLGEEALAAACQEANRKWQQSRLSTTGALQEAAAAGMQSMVRGGGPVAAGPGVCCATLQPERAYLALVGAARAYILAPQICRRVASSSPWDPNHVDIREESLPPKGMLLLAPSVLEGALPLLQGGLPPREVRRLIRAWLQDKPQLSALVAGHDDGREIGLGVGPDAELDKRQEETQPPAQPGVTPRASAYKQDNVRQPWRRGESGPSPTEDGEPPAEDEADDTPEEVPFPVLRALRFPLLALAALLALLVLGGIGLYLPTRQKGVDEARLSQLLNSASRVRQEASLQSDPATARNSLAQAEALVREAATMRPRDRRVISIAQEIGGDLDRVNSVIRPSGVAQLADLGKLGGTQSSPSRVLVDGNNLYVLDRGAGRLYKFILDQGGQSLLNLPNSVLIRKDDLHGGTLLAELWEALWMPPGPLRPLGSLLTLGPQGLLLDYRPDKGLQVLPLRGAQSWASFRAAKGFNGNLYVLDPAAGQVWRYIPTATGYDSEPRAMLEGAVISDAVDLAVDGNVYVVTAAGAVWRFSGGPLSAFRQEKIDRPISSAAAVFSTPSTRFVYVADRGGRVVAFTKEGEFRFQIKGEALEGIQGLFVDEDQGRLYLVSGQKVWVTSVGIPKP